MSSVINIVTAVSRPENLNRIRRSIARSIARSSLRVKWILVVDGEGGLAPALEASLKDGASFDIAQISHQGGSCPYGIRQKNLGMASIVEGYYHCLDDDNIVHPDFFQGIERSMKANPTCHAFVFGQQRWDNIKSLVAAPERMEYGKIDNTMFVVHSSVIGENRYDLSRSGREDFHFFRKLYDLYRSEFVFIPETLAYYNYITHFPSETKDEISEALPIAPQAQKPQVSPRIEVLPKTKGIMKIALYSSKRDRCGISTYTSNLEDALATLGHDVRHWGSLTPYEETFREILDWKPDVFHFQHETSIMPTENIIEKYSNLMNRDRIRVMVTLHTESEEAVRAGRKAVAAGAGSIIMHRPSGDAPEATFMPMPCTCIGSIPGKAELRRKYGLPEDAFIVSTVGFMIPWKDHPRIVEAMVPWLKKRGDVYLQIIASEHFNADLQAYAHVCRKQILESSKAFPEKRIRHIDGYPSDRELVERLAASDLGYVWCPFDTGSSSAAAAQFTTARCPLVATDSSHYAFLGTGIVRGPKGSLGDFIALIQKTADDQATLDQLRSNQWAMYKERNYMEFARRHLELYGLEDGGK